MRRGCRAEAMSFETIVASGERSRLPHGRATDAKLPKRGFVTLDFGVVLDGYCSDMTRTVHMGRRAGERSVYDAVLEAQEAAVAAVRAGVTAAMWMRRRAACCARQARPVVHPLDRAWGWAWRFTRARLAAKQTRC
jgi:Xaa-Pro aminopeptidase